MPHIKYVVTTDVRLSIEGERTARTLIWPMKFAGPIFVRL